MPFTSQEINELSILIVLPEEQAKPIVKSLRSWSFKHIKTTEDTRLFHQQNSVDAHLVFLPTEPGRGESSRVLIRHITHNQVVPSWAKIVLVGEAQQADFAGLPYRFLHTESIEDIDDEPALHRLVRYTLDAQQVLKKPIEEAHKYSPRELLQAVKQARQTELPEPVSRDLDMIMARFLFINGMSEAALTLTTRMQGIDKANAQSIIYYLMADYPTLENVLSQSASVQGFESKASCYRMITAVMAGHLEMTDLAERISDLEQDASYHQLALLNRYCQHGFSSTVTWLEQQQQQLSKDQHAAQHSLAGLAFMQLVIALLVCVEGNSADQAQAKQLVSDALRATQAATSGDFYSKYTVLINMYGLAVLGAKSNAKLRDSLKEMHSKTVRHPNIVVHLLQAACCAAVSLREEALDCLSRVDRLVAALEPSPELICIEIIWQKVIDQVAGVNDTASCYADVATRLQKMGLNYRALRRLAIACGLAADNAEFKLRMADGMVRLKLTQYQHWRLSEVLNSAAEASLSEKQKSLLKQIQRDAEQVFSAA